MTNKYNKMPIYYVQVFIVVNTRKIHARLCAYLMPLKGFTCMQFNHLGIQDRNLNVCLLKLKQTHRKRVIVVIIELLAISPEVGKRQLLFTHNRAFKQHITAAILILCFKGLISEEFKTLSEQHLYIRRTYKSSYVLSGPLQEDTRQWKILKRSSKKVDSVALERWLFTRSSK